MKDYYAILEVEKTASLEDIKRSYKKLLLKNDYNRGGSTEKAKDIIGAYEVLKDPEKREEYNQAWEVFHLDAVENTVTKVDGYISCDQPPYSYKYKQQHQQLSQRYLTEKCVRGNLRHHFDWDNEKTTALRDILNTHCELPPTFSILAIQKEALKPVVAITILQEFLQGAYSSIELNKIVLIFANNIQQAKSSQLYERDIKLYEGIYEILGLGIAKTINDNGLLKSFEKLNAYAQELAITADESSNDILKHLSILFSKKIYRKLFALALRYYWDSNEDELSLDHLAAYDGRTKVKEIIAKLKEQMLAERNKSVSAKLKLFLIIAKLEAHSNAYSNDETKDKAEFYRDKAYQLLDWMPALIGLVELPVITNTVLLAAISFLHASRAETVSSKQNADEKLACRLLILAITTANKTTPNVELYILTHALRYLAVFQFVDAEIKEIIPLIQRRCLFLADIYPFHEGYQSHTEILFNESKPLIMLRAYLHNLIDCINENSTSYPCELEYLKVLSEIYNACLDNWYQVKVDPIEEELYRQKLMQELLHVNSWTSGDVNKLLNPKYSNSVARDECYWMKPSRELVFGDLDHNEIYTSLNAVQIDYAKGEITLIATPWKEGDSTYSKLFTMYDLSEIHYKKATSAIFSLDPPDENYRYHPFNKVRFSPSSLDDTGLLHVMLLADYLLKFLTVGYEVQATAPYLIRSVKEFIANLPLHLQKIILDFLEAAKSGQTHRFWIEAEDLNASLDKSKAQESKHTYAFGEVKMRVKKHAMERDASGKLVDKADEDEGWDIYVLDSDSKEKIEAHISTKQRRALILSDNKFYFYENKKFSSAYDLDAPQFQLRLAKIRPDENGKISADDSCTQHLVYTLTKKCCLIASMPPHFSAEYIFAQEFTHHYNEFAMYFPELGRLRELSKAVMVTQLLESARVQNSHVIKDIRTKLDSSKHWEETAIKIAPQVRVNANAELDDLRDQTEYDQIKSKRQVDLDRLINDIGNRYTEANPAEKDKIIERIMELFSRELEKYSPENRVYIAKSFLSGTSNLLLDVLVAADKNTIGDMLRQKVYPLVDSARIQSALDREKAGIDFILNARVRDRISQTKSNLAEQLKSCIKLRKCFKEMSFTKKREEVDLSRTCLWVPASINHQLDGHYSRLVYGGVQIAAKINIVDNSALNNSVQQGVKVYRVFGNDAPAMGRSWTTTNPASVDNYRDKAGLPPQNSGRFVAEGRLRQPVGPIQPAVPLHGNRGGIPEVRLSDPKTQVKITRVSGVNPPF